MWRLPTASSSAAASFPTARGSRTWFARPSVCAENLGRGKLRTSTSRNPSSSRVPSADGLFSQRQLALHARCIRKIDRLMPIVAGTGRLENRGNSRLKSRAKIFDGSWRRFFHVSRKICAKNQCATIAWNDRVGDPDLAPAKKTAQQATKAFDTAQSAIVSILETEISAQSDSFLLKLKTDVEALEPMSKMDVAQHCCPKVKS